MRFSNHFLGLMLATSSAGYLAGCGSNPFERAVDHVSAYKIDIQQGNAINQDMLARLKPGMTPSQVRFVLGTPMLVDPFHGNRWDYVYRLEKGGRLIEHRRVTVVFENDKLKGIEGDVVAAAPRPGEKQ
jgi:outer membrane protein assembly factor BamE